MSIYIQDDKLHTVRQYNTTNKIEKAVETLLRSDEEDDILNKIRAEVAAIAITGRVDDHTMFTRTGDQVKQMILEIIDKYRKESENEG